MKTFNAKDAKGFSKGRKVKYFSACLCENLCALCVKIFGLI